MYPLETCRELALTLPKGLPQVAIALNDGIREMCCPDCYKPHTPQAEVILSGPVRLGLVVAAFIFTGQHLLHMVPS